MPAKVFRRRFHQISLPAPLLSTGACRACLLWRKQVDAIWCFAKTQRRLDRRYWYYLTYSKTSCGCNKKEGERHSLTTLVVRGALPLLFKRCALFRISQTRYAVSIVHRFKQFAKTPNASTSPQRPTPEPPEKHGMPVREIGGNAGASVRGIGICLTILFYPFVQRFANRLGDILWNLINRKEFQSINFSLLASQFSCVPLTYINNINV